jgi:hypothetical protein
MKTMIDSRINKSGVFYIVLSKYSFIAGHLHLHGCLNLRNAAVAVLLFVLLLEQWAVRHSKALLLIGTLPPSYWQSNLKTKSHNTHLTITIFMRLQIVVCRDEIFEHFFTSPFFCNSSIIVISG